MRPTRLAARCAAALASLAVVVGVAGCGPTGPTAPTASNPEAAGLASLEGLPGVASTSSRADAATGLAEVTVRLDDDATPEEVAAIGRASVAALAAPGPGLGSLELELGESVFAHFGAGGEDEVVRQLAYWLDLARLGFDRVVMRDLALSADDEAIMNASPTSSASAGAPPPAAPAPLATPATGARHVLLDLPPEGADGLDGLLALLDGARSIPDPGAPSGEWDVFGLGRPVTGEYHTAAMPDRAALDALAGFGRVLEPFADRASLLVRVDAAATPPLAAELTLFDESISRSSRATVETELESSDAFPVLTGLIAELDDAGAGFDLDVLGNPLTDAGNFSLGVTVRECAFAGDASWPQLSARLGEAWLRHRLVTQPLAVSSGACTVS